MILKINERRIICKVICSKEEEEEVVEQDDDDDDMCIYLFSTGRFMFSSSNICVMQQHYKSL